MVTVFYKDDVYVDINALNGSDIHFPAYRRDLRGTLTRLLVDYKRNIYSTKHRTEYLPRRIYFIFDYGGKTFWLKCSA